MNAHGERLGKWFYRGLWGVLADWFRVPRQPPALPQMAGEMVDTFQPAPGFLRYLKFQFWIILLLVNAAVVIGWIVIAGFSTMAGVLLAPLALLIAVVPDLIAYLAIHLRYDTTWYVMTDRSLRVRRGIWVIHETTITFENIQNVKITQGPLQRFFGIADVMVETAGGGSGGSHQGHAGGRSAAHQGLIEGVADAQRIRGLLLERLGRSRWGGLGDDEQTRSAAAAAWSPAHLALLREIRDAAARLATDSSQT